MRPLIFIGLLYSNPNLAAKPVPVKIESKAQHTISPYIYGFGSYMHEDRDAEGIWEMRPSLYRWGGNTSTRFNYKVNAWNAANDWYFHNFEGRGPNMINSFMADNLRNKAASMITLPMLGWVAKDGSSVSFPRSVYPNQDRFEGDAGNGQFKGKDLKSDPKRTSVAIDPAFVAGWVKILKKQFGSNPHFYIMDNEPMLWHSTHRDVQGERMGYDSYFQRYVSYAKAVREADPDAVIVGPALWGWMAMMQSAKDIESEENKWQRGTDRKKHRDKPFLEWFLEQLALEEKKLDMSLLDVLDVHFYPEKDRWPKGDESAAAVRKTLLTATRSLWDKSFTDPSWINEKIYFIPRLQAMAAKFKPTAKVSIGEYNFRSEMDVSGAIAQAEILGVFARTNLYAAQYWDFPKKDGTHKYAFHLFRNFDGKGSGFASRWVDNSVGSKDDYSVFSARDDKRLTVVILNKDLNEKQSFELDLGAWPKARSARTISYKEAKPGSAALKKAESKVALEQSKKVKISADPLSMQIVEIQF